MHASGNITVESGSVTGTGGKSDKDSYGVYANGDITASGGSITSTGGYAGGANSSYGVYANGDITASGGSITGTGGYAVAGSSCSYGVYANKDIKAENGGSITGTCGSTEASRSYGVCAWTGSIEATNRGSIKGTGGTSSMSYGVYTSVDAGSNGSIKVNSGGSITGIGGTPTGGDQAGSFGVRTVDSNVSIIVDNGTITGTAGTAQQSYGFLGGVISFQSGRLVGESAVGSYFGAIRSASSSLPAACYWRTSKSAAYTRYESPTQQAYVWDAAQTYVDIRTSLPNTPSITVSVPAFGLGQAPHNETVTIKSDETINATNNFDSATMDGQPIDLGTVNGTPGAHGSVRDGSSVIQLNKAYLDTLTVGTHTIRVNLAAAFAGKFVEGQITVLPSGDVPETGDSAMPVLWLGLMLLAGAGLAASIVRRRKRRNG